MNQIVRRFILAFTLIAGLAPAFAQAPPPVPALPDTERRTTYSISGSSCACAVGFQLYGDGSDFWNWLEVYLNGTRVNFDDPTFGWTVTSPSGQLGRLALPITDAAMTFNNPQTGTVQILGARRPRRVSQFSEGAGVSARDLNVALTDLVAQNWETWDRTNDVTGRALMAQPGNTLGLLPPPSLCQGAFLVFDATGKNPQCVTAAAGTGTVVGPPTSTIGHFATYANTNGSALQDGGAPAPSATTDTTNASNISSGTLGAGRLPVPFTNGTASGNTNKFGTVGTPFVNGNCVQVDASGNLTTTATSCLSAAGANTSTYWDTMYRLLDPAGYVYQIGTSMSLTVPAGRTWYVLNAWNAFINGAGPYFLRKPNIHQAVMLPAGTTITTTASQTGFIYYCDPANSAAPSGDPQEAYFKRLNRLKSLPVAGLSAPIAAGSANATQATPSFPATFTNAMLISVSNMEVAWTGLLAAGGNGAMNTAVEVSDRHEQRFTEQMLMPFARATFPAIEVQGANVAGDQSSATLGGNGMVLYQPLPSDW
jgi:hypothetical protein